MNRTSIKAVRQEAERVIGLCRDAEVELGELGRNTYIGGTKTSGALRRASLDLTRKLAEMRRA